MKFVLAAIPGVLEELKNMPKTATVIAIGMLVIPTYMIGSPFYFARAADVETIKQTVNISAQIQLEQKILELALKRCQAKDSNSKFKITSDISERQKQFEGIASGNRVSIASCDELCGSACKEN